MVDKSRDGVVCAHMGKLGWVRWVVCKKLGGVACVPHLSPTHTSPCALTLSSSRTIFLTTSALPRNHSLREEETLVHKKRYRQQSTKKTG